MKKEMKHNFKMAGAYILFIGITIALLLCFLLIPKKDNFTFPDNNMTYWPQYYYSFPYNYKNGGVWPPGMYNRLNYWSPGFYTGTGIMWGNRPGMGEKWWPRNRWINHNTSPNSYYNITNSDDWIHDAADYSNSAFFQ